MTHPTSSNAKSADPPAPAHPLLATLSLATVAGTLVALAAGALDGVVAAARAPTFAPGAILLGLALAAPVGILFGIPLGLVAGGIRALIPPGSPTLRAHLRANPRADQSVAAGLIAVLACLAMEVAIVHFFNLTVASGMANRRLAALSTGLVSGAGLVACGLAFFPLFHAARLLTRRLPRPTAVIALLAVGGLGLATSVVLGSLDWRVLRFGPWLALGAIALATLLIVLRELRRASGWERPRAFALAIVLGGGLALSSPWLGGNAQGVEAATRGGTLLPLLVELARAATDRDGDGYSARFAGGDCDDGDAAVHPGATDVPGNGIDENCEGGDARPPARRSPRATTGAAPVKLPRFDGNLLLICIDTLRADRLGIAGNKGKLTPNLDALASEGVYFANAFAQGPNTPQSFPSIFTSLYPSRVPYRKTFTGYPEMKPEALTFWEVLQQQKIATAAVTSHFYFTDKRGITQGFDSWDNRDATNIKDSNKDIASPRIVPRAIDKLKELASARRRFALFVHLSEPHSTYVTHPGPDFRITERGVKGLEQKYDMEIRFVDGWLRKLLDGLREAGLEQTTAVMLFGDHAEAFGEHKLYFHGQTLYNEILHVPLVLRVPGGPRRVVRDRVALLDIGPTVLELMGARVPDSFQGVSLLPLAHGAAADPARRIGAVLLAYPAWPKAQQAAFLGDHKAIFRVTENRFEAYDLKRDPGEQKDLAQSDAALAAKLRAQLTRFVEEELQ